MPWRAEDKPVGASRVKAHHGNKMGFYIVGVLTVFHLPTVGQLFLLLNN